MFGWMPFLAYAATTSITPGPNNIMSMSSASRLGLRKSLPFNLGVLVGFLAVGTLCTLLMDALGALVPAIKTPMKVLGALYLLYLAYRSLASDPHIAEARSHGGFFTAVVLQFINPKLYLCVIMSMEMFIMPHFAGQTPVLLGFVLLMALMAFVSTLSWALFGAAFKRLFTNHTRTVGIVMALLLVYCAVSLFID